MSLANNPEDKPTPVLKDKNPHNYRKVGYCMIIISVSLVVILLLSWALASDYHFSSNIMALQEVDTMTPKAGYNIVLFDISQPVGAKLKMLDHADTLDSARQLQSQDATQNPGSTIQVLIFNSTEDYNLNQMVGAEVFLQTPKTGYNVIFDNYELAVGAKLVSGSYQASLANATAYEKQAQDQIQGLDEKLLIFTPSFTDNLKMITNSSTPVTNYTLVLPPSLVSSAPQTSANQTTPVASSSASNTTAVVPSQVQSNKTTTVAVNKTAVTSTNQTVMISTTPNATSVVANKTTVMLSNSTISTVTANKTASMMTNQTNTTSSKTTMNTTASTKVAMNATATAVISKSVSLNETVSLNATGK